MKSEQTQRYAVITGDIVKYSNLPVEQRQDLEPLLHDCGKQIGQHFADELASPLIVFRGDSWQLVLKNPRAALRTALYLRALLIAASHDQNKQRLDTRFAIGVGAIDFLPNKTNTSGGGIAFVLSGRKLDEIKPGSGMGISIDDKDSHPLSKTWDVIVQLIDALARDWTPSQATAISWALLNLIQKEIAKKYSPPISQQGVAKHLNSAAWPTVERAIEFYEIHFGRL
jgi:hypothetical protein